MLARIRDPTPVQTRTLPINVNTPPVQVNMQHVRHAEGYALAPRRPQLEPLEPLVDHGHAVHDPHTGFAAFAGVRGAPPPPSFSATVHTGQPHHAAVSQHVVDEHPFSDKDNAMVNAAIKQNCNIQ